MNQLSYKGILMNDVNRWNGRDVLSYVAEVLIYIAVLLVLFLLMGTTFGDDKLKLPEQVKSQSCKLIKIQAETKGKKIVWIIPKEFEADSLDGPRLVGVVS